MGDGDRCGSRRGRECGREGESGSVGVWEWESGSVRSTACSTGDCHPSQLEDQWEKHLHTESYTTAQPANRHIFP